MKQRRHIFWFALILIVPLLSSAQNLVLDDYSHSGSLYLNNLIAADSTSTAFTAGTRVYVLRKDGEYMFNGPITTYTGHPIVLTVDPADTGYANTGLKPECYGVLGSSKKLPSYFVVMQNGGRVELHNINVSGYRSGDVGGADSLIGYQQGAIIDIGTAGGTGRIIIDGCVLHGVNGNHIRTDGVTDSVMVTNTIFADMGNVAPSNYGAGKAFDLRNVDIAYCKIQNCTFVNAQDRIVRHYQSTSPIHNFIFDHNTVVNSMSYHGFLSLGKVDSTGTGILQITNNLLVDHFALGADTAYIRQVEFSDPGELDAFGNPRMAWVLTNKNNAAVWNIKNNYYAITDSGAAVRALKASDGYIPRADTTKEDPFLTWNMNTVLASQGKDTTATFKKIKVSMTSVPPLMTSMIRWVYTPRTTAMTLTGTYSNPNYGGTNIGVTIPYSLSTHGDGKQKNSGDTYYKASLIPGTTGIYALDYNRKSLEWYAWYPYESQLGVGNVLNCSYKSSVNLQSAGTDGKTIGDPRWTWNGFIPGIVIFTASQTTVNFDTVAKNASKTDTIVVSSGGSSPLVIDSVKSTATEFTVTPTNATISAGSSQKFAITYHPTTPGAKSGNIIFYHNTISDTVSVSGNVVSAAAFVASPISIDFGTLTGTVGTNISKKDSTVVTNHGTIALNITNVTSSNSLFTVTPTTATVGVESSQTFYITFTPTASGAQTGKITFVDNSLTKDTITVKGNATVTSVLGSAIPKAFQLHDNYPNPFNPSTTIKYDLPQQSTVTLKVYSLLGQEVATLVDGEQTAGYHQIVWMGKNDNGKIVSSGVYFLRIFAKANGNGNESFTQVKKMLMLK
ncbi:MAG TPA: choice-of-anchor D domain-containing protein [Bacteroidota bacterium]|nr:choice-of-anchor D domain-containing protein [Bacteroidota bacterium]